MVTLTSLLAALVSGLMLQAPAQPPAAGPAPKLVVTERMFDVGDVMEGDVADLKWTIENRGEGDLLIERVQPTCGCTVVEIAEKDRVLKPGGTFDIKAVFHSHDRPGQQEKLLVLHTNDPTEPQVQLLFRAKVRRLFEMRPSSGVVHLRGVQRGQPAVQTLDILDAPGEPAVEVLALTFPDSSPITATVSPFVDPQRQISGQRVSFAAKSGAMPDKLSVEGMAKIRVGDMVVDRSVKVIGNVVGAVTIRPQVIDATRAPARRGQKLVPVRIIAHSAAGELKILSADAGPMLDIEHEPTQEGLRPGETGHLVRVTVRENAPIGPFGAMVRLRTDSLDQPLIEIPVYVQVAAPIAVEPSAVLFKVGDAQSERLRKISLDAAPVTDYQIAEATSDNPAVVATFEPHTGALSTLRTVEISLGSQLPTGVHQANVTIRTTGTDAEAIVVPVTIVVP
jgi:hypothetical protein